MRPTCVGGCGKGQYCSASCECVDAAEEQLSDFVIDRTLLREDILIAKRNFPASSCALDERCVGGVGIRRLLVRTRSIRRESSLARSPPPVRSNCRSLALAPTIKCVCLACARVKRCANAIAGPRAVCVGRSDAEAVAVLLQPVSRGAGVGLMFVSLKTSMRVFSLQHYHFTRFASCSLTMIVVGRH